VYQKVACRKLKTIIETYRILNITQTNLSHRYQLAATSMHCVCSSVEGFKEAGFELLQRGIQNSGDSESPRTAFKSGFAHKHNQAWKDKTSENIPVTCKIRYTVNRIDLLTIK